MIESKNEELIIADNNFQQLYASANTIDALKTLLETERQNYKRAIREVGDNIKENVQRMNGFVVKCYEDITQLPQSITRLEDMISQYEIDLEEKSERILDQEGTIDDLKLQIEDLRRLIVNPPPVPQPQQLTPGQINYINDHKIYYICERIKVSHTVTAKSFNQLLTLTINNKESPHTSIRSWRRKAMAAYAIRIAAAGRQPNEFRDDEYLDVVRCIRMIVRNNAADAKEVPDVLDELVF